MVSIRKCAETVNLTKSSVHRICKKKLKLYPYKILLVQELSELDQVFRCESAILYQQILPKCLNLFFFSDEATFKTDGTVNRWNCRVWGNECPNRYQISKQNAGKVTVWAAISSAHVFGPYFFPGNVTGDEYRAIIENFFIPDLQQQFNANEFNQVWFMQDGAPAHTAAATQTLLQTTFGENIVSRFMQIEWPPRSPDLNPCDYFLWGYIRDKVYHPDNGLMNGTPDLTNRILTAFHDLRNNAMENVQTAVESFYPRLLHCLSLDGRQLGLVHK